MKKTDRGFKQITGGWVETDIVFYVLFWPKSKCFYMSIKEFKLMIFIYLFIYQFIYLFFETYSSIKLYMTYIYFNYEQTYLQIYV